MQNVQQLRPGNSGTAMEHAVVKGGGADAWLVQNGQGLVTARCALSCLVQPAADDLVLLSSSGHEHYILAVLSRQQTAVDIHLRGDTRLHSDGALELHSDKRLGLASSQQVQVTAADVGITGVTAQVTAQKLSLRIPEVEADHDDVNIRARSINSWAERVTQRTGSLMRWVEGVETAHIGQLVKSIRGAFTVNAEHAVVTARKDVKIDGERIHMG